MKAYRLQDQLSVQDLLDAGIMVDTFPPTAEGQQEVRTRLYAYPVADEVTLDESTASPEVLNSFATEHRHSTDEVRWVIEGNGIFDIRDLNDRWIRIYVSASDLLILPANRWHLFILQKRIKVIRLFGQDEGWQAEYR